MSHVAPEPPKIYSDGYYLAPVRKPTSRRRTWLSILLILVVGGLSVVGFANRQRIVDQFAVWGFSESSVIKAYVTRSTMSGEGAFLFLASKPQVATATRFNSICANHEEGSGILGCYLPDARTITLFDVTDPRLDGIEEVVAAHEMLHAAWDRMGQSERDTLTRLLEAEYATHADDKDLVARMAFYARTEPGEEANELHSILGTEVAQLSPALEKYYSQYFSNRQSLVALHVKSNAVFVDLETRSAALVSELDALKTSIESDYATYNSGYEQLNKDIAAFNAKASNGGFSSDAEFSSARNGLLNRQRKLDALFASIQARNDDYNAKVQELNSLNTTAAGLNASINIVPHSSTGTSN